MEIKEILEIYKKRHREKEVSEEISKDIENITISDYEEHYKKIYKDRYGLNFDAKLSLKEMNSNFIKINEYNSLLNSDDCIFDVGSNATNDFFI